MTNRIIQNVIFIRVFLCISFGKKPILRTIAIPAVRHIIRYIRVEIIIILFAVILFMNDT